MGRVLLISALILLSFPSFSDSRTCRDGYSCTYPAVCKNVTVSFTWGEGTGYELECRCGQKGTCRTKGAKCRDVWRRYYSRQLDEIVIGAEGVCQCPSTSLEFRLTREPYCLHPGYSDWFQHTVPQLGFVSELVEKSSAVLESLQWTFLSIMKNGTKVCEWISCSNRAAMCSDITVFKKLLDEPTNNYMSMKDLQALVCKILSTNMTQMYVDLTRETLMVKDVVRMMLHMGTITHAELETVAENMNKFITHLYAFASDPKPIDQKLGLSLPPEKTFVSRSFNKEFSQVVVNGFANLYSGDLKAWLKGVGECQVMRMFVSKVHGSLRYAIFMMKKLLEFTVKEDVIGTLKDKLPQTKKILDMMDDSLTPAVVGTVELALRNPLQMHNMLDKLLSVLLDDPNKLCTDSSFLEGYDSSSVRTKMKDILDLFCRKLDYDALWKELGLDRLVDEVKTWFVVPSSEYTVHFDPDKFVDDTKQFVNMFGPLGKIGWQWSSNALPIWMRETHWSKPMTDMLRRTSVWNLYSMSLIQENVKKFLVYLRLAIPNTLTNEQNLAFLNVQDIITLVYEILKGLGGSLDYLSTTFGNTVEMKKIVNLLTYDLPTVFEKALVDVVFDVVKLGKFTKALQDEDACDQSSSLYSVIGDNPLTRLVCSLDTAKLEKELASLAANNKMVKALYQLLFQKYDGQTFSEVSFISELEHSVFLADHVLAMVKAIAQQDRQSLKPWLNSTVWRQKWNAVQDKTRTVCDDTAHTLDCIYRYIKSSLPAIRWKMLNGVTVALSAVARYVDGFVIDDVLKPLDDLIQGMRECEKGGLSQASIIIISTVCGAIALLILIIIVIVVLRRLNKVPSRFSSNEAAENPTYDKFERY